MALLVGGFSQSFDRVQLYFHLNVFQTGAVQSDPQHFLAKEEENHIPLTLCQPLVLLASFVALVVLCRLLSHQIPKQHAERCVRGQAEEDRAHAFVQAQHAFSLAHLEHTV